MNKYFIYCEDVDIWLGFNTIETAHAFCECYNIDFGAIQTF